MNIVDMKMIIINLLKEDKKTYLSVERLQHLITFIYNELSRENQLDKYRIYFNINFNAIERTVLYNNNIFKLDIDGEMIYLREENSVDNLAEKYKVDETITQIISNFVSITAA